MSALIRRWFCAKCAIDVQPSNWYRLVTGVLLCGACFHESQPKRKAVR